MRLARRTGALSSLRADVALVERTSRLNSARLLRRGYRRRRSYNLIKMSIKWSITVNEPAVLASALCTPLNSAHRLKRVFFFFFLAVKRFLCLKRRRTVVSNQIC